MAEHPVCSMVNLASSQIHSENSEQNEEWKDVQNGKVWGKVVVYLEKYL